MSISGIYKENKEVIGFLLRFLGVYIFGNLIYGFAVTQYRPVPDPITILVARQSSVVIQAMGYSVQTYTSKVHETVLLTLKGGPVVLEVFEGCNGVNVMIIFSAFLIAVGKAPKTMVLVLAAGTLIIHLINLLRIGGLFWVAMNRPHDFYFIHKYFFTAVLYVLIFILWTVWLYILLPRINDKTR
jgi:exosortase family protein XrtF